MYKLNSGYIALCIPNTYREFATKWLRLVESFHYLMCSLNNDSFEYGTFLHLPQPFYDFRLARHLHKNPFIYIEVSWVSGFLRGIFILYIYFYDSCASCVYGVFLVVCLSRFAVQMMNKIYWRKSMESGFARILKTLSVFRFSQTNKVFSILSVMSWILFFIVFFFSVVWWFKIIPFFALLITLFNSFLFCNVFVYTKHKKTTTTKTTN